MVPLVVLGTAAMASLVSPVCLAPHIQDTRNNRGALCRGAGRSSSTFTGWTGRSNHGARDERPRVDVARMPMATEEKTEPVLVIEQRDAVKILRLNRPEARNSLNPELARRHRPEHGGGRERPRYPCDRPDAERATKLSAPEWTCGHSPPGARSVPARKVWPVSSVSPAERSRFHRRRRQRHSRGRRLRAAARL